MAKTRIGINGFGRIGRQVFKAILSRYTDTLQVVAINDLGSPDDNAHLLKYDTAYGRYDRSVEVHNGNLVIDGNLVQVFAERSPEALPWNSVGVSIVIESTGFFTNAKIASQHLAGGAQKVIISAPATNEDLTIVLGVNDSEYDPAKHHIVSNASCTTNCVAPMAKVLDESFGIEQALMSTIHSYTNDQRILDQVHSDLRRARSAAASIIPTTTGAARAVIKVIPSLQGRIDGMAYRVPTITGSVTDLSATLHTPATCDQVNEAFCNASSGALANILAYSDEPLVSADYIGQPQSCTIDGLATIALSGGMVKVVGWYDNEWGYSSRTADLANIIADKLPSA